MSTESFRSATGRKVIASDTAESIGSVKGFVLDEHGRSIEAIHIDGHGKRAIILNWPDVQSFGVDAVMTAVGAVPSTIDNAHQKAAVKGVVSMLGARVLTVGGHELGNVADVEFDIGSGAVVRVSTEHGSVEAPRLRSLGSYALVVDDVTTAPG